eukprot:gnl/TRDRNA2_/TRDRNA2_138742_c0_seq1.p1 gnl/TRDRNA2_/TRDRNA2_138742_c0~~gnl/TRDRNA2_/TRDRNA2_138742_c0_seq1.p1  ORF type:complete len:400 (+),score=65.38 gnl/TRDRNA2_/TRDRNA2_138742_c0_seq1:64-1263(+)
MVAPKASACCSWQCCVARETDDNDFVVSSSKSTRSFQLTPAMPDKPAQPITSPPVPVKGSPLIPDTAPLEEVDQNGIKVDSFASLYETCKSVGHGTFGKVLVVRCRQTKQMRACKIVVVKSEPHKDMIDNEVELLKSLDHPGIIALHHVFFECGFQTNASGLSVYLITELCNGGDLTSKIRRYYEELRHPMMEGHAACILKQILSATSYCHARGVVHRDMKPDNILFLYETSLDQVKIVDFGLADFMDRIRENAQEVKVLRQDVMGRLSRMLLPAVRGKHLIKWHERKQVMQSVGTINYMAPEVMIGDYDERADLFSIGVILCQLLTGRHPFVNSSVHNEEAVRAMISSPEPAPITGEVWSRVSAKATDLCRGLLEKSAKKRLSAEQALEHPWLHDAAR